MLNPTIQNHCIVYSQMSRNLFFYAPVTMLFLSWLKIYHFVVAFIVVEDNMLEGFDLVFVIAKPT